MGVRVGGWRLGGWDEPGGEGSLWSVIYRGVVERFAFHGVLERVLEGGRAGDELARER